MPPPVSSLPDELVEEFLLHLPSDTPASLVRAGLVCKRWCRLISGAGFRRKFHEFHRSSPMLGFLYYQRDIAGDHVARFIPISASCPPAHHAGDDGSHCGMSPWDSPWPLYSSEAGTWSDNKPSSGWIHGDHVSWRRSALVENQLYFVSARNKRIIEYDLDTREISVIDLPAANSVCNNELLCPALVELTTMEDGRLGFTRVENFRLSLWSRQVEGAGWELSKVIDLGTFSVPHGQGHYCPYLVGSAEGIGVVLLWVKGVLFTVDLRSKQMIKVYAGLYPSIGLVVPYLNFYTPGISYQCPSNL
ncbi:hypothetical protein HU200_016455 [Digitaria exilis]|uniref:F-box domain-containing protein n=1 Tax=Digitaria exilis TaxID=1010633 RepID=A0A835F882_9POAL|nr:hypothetical protein HU200_016455 [Digitaria exilis]